VTRGQDDKRAEKLVVKRLRRLKWSRPDSTRLTRR
jgi:hypothetical protein